MKIQDFTNIVIYDNENRILMQKRCSKAKIYPNYWGLFGGKIEKDESHRQAIVREIKEELDFSLDNPIFAFETPYFIEEIAKGNWFVYTYKMNDNEKKILRLLEGEDWGWHSFSEIEKLKINDDMREVLKKIENIIKYGK